jgi:hypothetical protein
MNSRVCPLYMLAHLAMVGSGDGSWNDNTIMIEGHVILSIVSLCVVI